LTFDAIREKIGIAPSRTILGYLGELSDWVQTHPEKIKARVSQAVEYVIGKVNGAMTVVKFLIDHSKVFSSIIGGALMIVAINSAVSHISLLTASLRGLAAQYIATGAVANSTRLLPGPAGAGAGVVGAGGRALTSAVVAGSAANAFGMGPNA